MTGSIRDDVDGDYICLHCERGKCHRCTERACTCCSGVPDNDAA
ncbi:MAG TPA: hypothetical protein VHZ03_25430 [Trebonia sp.]|nr:hypothetical protein [Trebonia sp.]